MAAGVPLMVVIPVCYSVVPENHSGVPSIHGNAATERQVYTISDVINTPARHSLLKSADKMTRSHCKRGPAREA